MEVKLVEDISVLNGSSYMGVYVRATENELRTLLAAPPDSNDPEIGWAITFNGKPLSVYFNNHTDIGLAPNWEVAWHIGGFDRQAAKEYARHLENCLLLLRNK